MVWRRRRYPFGSLGHEIDEMMGEMETRFQDLFSGGRTLLPEGGAADRLLPAVKGEFRVDVCEHEGDVVVVADLPGIEKENVNVRLHDPRTLEISTERREEKKEEEENYFMRERVYGSMRRLVRLPGDVDEESAQASFKNGVLEIRLRLTEKETGRTIPVN
ncbi:heat-shock protein Hsp20 [Methanocalculus chunghsingensis]|uniref:Heat-shock protein Hsp20 n=1 Tax=Methanocalculus chunghsingensis TaxID=156457 RepID=A0A8J8B3W4_9EURY|nr:Hsp20/alpha crystallin family protein [Methanocalculus chunghsingensis]MBR1368665.1 heat-shock protein Hsp20 [Methanocalculus chunghsingensis]